MTIWIQSPAFSHGDPIPRRYTCDGESAAPALSWTGIPEGTRSLTLIMDDPDAPRGNFLHWLVTDLPPDTTGLSEGAPLPASARVARNDAGLRGYAPPCPPPGAPHRYFFRLYALDMRLELPPDFSRTDALQAMEGHVLDEGELMGTYGRSR